MKPEDRRRLKRRIEMIVEHKEPVQSQTEKILRDAIEEQIKGKLELEDKNRKLRLELYTLRSKEAQEQRFIWWIWNVYARNVGDLLTELERTTFPVTPYGMSYAVKRLKEYTEHIYDGTYLDTAMSTEPSNSDVSMTESVLTDVKTGQSIENTNPDYYKDAEEIIEYLEIRLSEWRGVARQLEDELKEEISSRCTVVWEEAGETSPAWIAYNNLVDIEDAEEEENHERR